MFDKRNERIERANAMLERELDGDHASPVSNGSNYVSDTELFRKMGINTMAHSKGVN